MESPLELAADHPAYRGHFPGRPVLPGVVLLAEVMHAVALGTGSLVWYLLTDSAAVWLPNTMPYVLVLLVLIFAAQRLRPPRAAGKPYRRGDH